MFEFVMLVGLPCSGKSTYTEKYFSYTNIISSDEFIEQVAKSAKSSYASVFKDTIDSANKHVETMLSLNSFEENDIVLDQTNLTVKSRARKLKMLKNRDKYFKTAVYFDTPIEIIKERLTLRNESGKIISLELLERMQAQLQPPTLLEGFDEVIVIEQQDVGKK